MPWRIFLSENSKEKKPLIDDFPKHAQWSIHCQRINYIRYQFKPLFHSVHGLNAGASRLPSQVPTQYLVKPVAASPVRKIDFIGTASLLLPRSGLESTDGGISAQGKGAGSSERERRYRPPAPESILPPAQAEAYRVNRQSTETETRRTLHQTLVPLQGAAQYKQQMSKILSWINQQAVHIYLTPHNFIYMHEIENHE